MRVLIIEDEARIARRIERMTREHFASDLKTVDILESIEQGVDYIKDNQIDILLLDLNLNGADGFTVLKTVVSEPFHTIIISAYTEKAITAFEYGVLDFVPKPFDKERLSQAFARFTTKARRDRESIRFLAVKKGHQILLVEVPDILYVKGAGIYTELHLKNGRREIYDKSLENLEQLLPLRFQRTHKSYLVDVSEAKEIVVLPGGKYRLLLKSRELLPIGRTRYKQLKNLLFGGV